MKTIRLILSRVFVGFVRHHNEIKNRNNNNNIQQTLHFVKYKGENDVMAFVSSLACSCVSLPSCSRLDSNRSIANKLCLFLFTHLIDAGPLFVHALLNKRFGFQFKSIASLFNFNWIKMEINCFISRSNGRQWKLNHLQLLYDWSLS